MPHTWRKKWWGQVVGVLAALTGWKWLAATYSATLAPLGALNVRRAEVNALEHTSVDGVGDDVGEPLVGPRGHLWCVREQCGRG